jgi:hypothetical protein
MSDRNQARWTVALLVPALLVFSFQWTAEVFHPIEEPTSEAHDHPTFGTSVVFDPSACGTDAHAPHFCPHSGAYARIVHLTATFDVGAHRISNATLPETFVTLPTFDFFERGPPNLG